MKTKGLLVRVPIIVAAPLGSQFLTSFYTWGDVAFPSKICHVLPCKALVLIKLVTIPSPLFPRLEALLAGHVLCENIRKSLKASSFILNSHSFHTVLETAITSHCLARECIWIHMDHQELKGEFLYNSSHSNKHTYDIRSDYFRKSKMRVNIQLTFMQLSCPRMTLDFRANNQ